MKREDACIIWTKNGCWLQVMQAGNAAKLSGLGKLPLAPLEKFCRERGIDLLVDHSTGRKLATEIQVNDNPLPEYADKPFDGRVVLT